MTYEKLHHIQFESSKTHSAPQPPKIELSIRSYNDPRSPIMAPSREKEASNPETTYGCDYSSISKQLHGATDDDSCILSLNNRVSCISRPVPYIGSFENEKEGKDGDDCGETVSYYRVTSFKPTKVSTCTKTKRFKEGCLSDREPLSPVSPCQHLERQNQAIKIQETTADESRRGCRPFSSKLCLSQCVYDSHFRPNYKSHDVWIGDENASSSPYRSRVRTTKHGYNTQETFDIRSTQTMDASETKLSGTPAHNDEWINERYSHSDRPIKNRRSTERPTIPPIIIPGAGRRRESTTRHEQFGNVGIYTGSETIDSCGSRYSVEYNDEKSQHSSSKTQGNIAVAPSNSPKTVFLPSTEAAKETVKASDALRRGKISNTPRATTTTLLPKGKQSSIGRNSFNHDNRYTKDPMVGIKNTKSLRSSLHQLSKLEPDEKLNKPFKRSRTIQFKMGLDMIPWDEYEREAAAKLPESQPDRRTSLFDPFSPESIKAEKIRLEELKSLDRQIQNMSTTIAIVLTSLCTFWSLGAILACFTPSWWFGLALFGSLFLVPLGGYSYRTLSEIMLRGQLIVLPVLAIMVFVLVIAVIKERGDLISPQEIVCSVFALGALAIYGVYTWHAASAGALIARRNEVLFLHELLKHPYALINYSGGRILAEDSSSNNGSSAREVSQERECTATPNIALEKSFDQWVCD